MKFTKDIIIGLEIHAELNTKTKLFCACARTGNETPNTRTCHVCVGHPGSKPVLNKSALDSAIKLAIALNCKLSPTLIFSRKTYFYPDLAKNYQITQYEEPLGTGGKLMLNMNTFVALTRVHIEEDPAALIHEKTRALIDYNRSGNPLCEIVTEPTIDSPKQARTFLEKLLTLLAYLKIHDSTCIMKADANISIKETNYTRIEIKNIGSFKEVERALLYEIVRQQNNAKYGIQITQETRGWDAKTGTTYSMRTKETEDDYGYIIDTDLSPVIIPHEYAKILSKEIPELAHEKAARFTKSYKLSPIDADVLTAEFELAELFEKVAKNINPILAAKWLRRELLRVLNYNNRTIKEADEKKLIELLSLVETKQITETTGQRLMEKLIEDATFSPDEYVHKHKLNKISEEKTLTSYCKKAIQENEKAVRDYLNGEKKALQYIVGQVMRISKGTAEAQKVQKIVLTIIEKK